jgi:large subunit ribosomal protein L32
MRQTHGKTRRRRSHHGLTEARLSTCEKCGANHLRHRVCEVCGSYRGKQVIDTSKKLEKKMKKEKNTEGAETAASSEEKTS